MSFLQDAIACVFLALFFLCGASPSASYSSQWSEPPYLCQDDQFTTSYSCEEDILTALLAVLSVRLCQYANNRFPLCRYHNYQLSTLDLYLCVYTVMYIAGK